MATLPPRRGRASRRRPRRPRSARGRRCPNPVERAHATLDAIEVSGGLRFGSGRARTAWSSTSYVYALDCAIRAPRLRQASTIAVVSPRAGGGATMIAVLLDSLFDHLQGGGGPSANARFTVAVAGIGRCG